MGDYMRYKPSSMQLDGVRYLIAYGLTRQYIGKDYKLVAHNQVDLNKLRRVDDNFDFIIFRLKQRKVQE